MSENGEQGITLVNRARRMLAKAQTVEEAREVVDIAQLARMAAKKAQLGLEAQNEAAEVHIRARRLRGELIRQGQESGKIATKGRPDDKSNSVLLLSDLGISKMDSSRDQKILDIPKPDFEHFIVEKKEAHEELTMAGALRLHNKLNRPDFGEAPPLPDGKYRVIYADPAWAYDNSGFDQSAAQHYPTMPIDEICELPIGELAAEPSVLYLWATSPLLPEAIRAMDAWGFEYKAHRIWKKNRAPGAGWWLKTYHELLLIGAANGNYHPIARLPSVVEAPVEQHSKKPECFRQDIEKMHDGPYVELFARRAAEGWDTWGNENV